MNQPFRIAALLLVPCLLMEPLHAALGADRLPTGRLGHHTPSDPAHLSTQALIPWGLSWHPRDLSWNRLRARRLHQFPPHRAGPKVRPGRPRASIFPSAVTQLVSVVFAIGLIQSVLHPPAFAQRVGGQPKVSSLRRGYVTLDTLRKHVARMPDDHVLNLTRVYRVETNAWILKEISVQAHHSREKLGIVELSGMPSIAGRPAFGDETFTLDVVTARTLRRLLVRPSALPSFVAPKIDIPEPLPLAIVEEPDPAGIPMAERGRPHGRLAWERYNEQDPASLIYWDAPSRTHRQGFFPFDSIHDIHQAETDTEHAIAEEFRKMSRRWTPPSVPVLLFFAQIESGLTLGSTQRIVIRDSAGRRQPAIGIFVDADRLTEHYGSASRFFMRDVGVVLNHEWNHVPQVLFMASTVLQKADQISDRLRQEGRPVSDRVALERLVMATQLSAFEIQASEQIGPEILRESSELVRKNEAAYTAQNRTNLPLRISKIIEDFFGNPSDPQKREALERWLTDLFRPAPMAELRQKSPRVTLAAA